MFMVGYEPLEHNLEKVVISKPPNSKSGREKPKHVAREKIGQFGRNSVEVGWGAKRTIRGQYEEIELLTTEGAMSKLNKPCLPTLFLKTKVIVGDLQCSFLPLMFTEIT